MCLFVSPLSFYYGFQETVVEAAGLERVFRAMELHEDDGFLQEVAAAAVSNCLTSPAARDIATKVGLGLILAAMRRHGDNVALLENACSCLGALTATSSGRNAVVLHDGLSVVCAALDAHPALGSLQEKGCVFLRNLAGSPSHHALLVHGGALAVLHRVRWARWRTSPATRL